MTTWRLVLAPWVGGGRLYTYLLPPIDEYWNTPLGPNDIILVEGPKGQPKFLEIAEIKELEPQPFPCKAVANAWTAIDYQQAREDEIPLSMHPSYPEWTVMAARINQGENPNEALAGEDPLNEKLGKD